MINTQKPIEVDVVISAYNVGPYIGQAIESVLNQNLSPKSIVVVDDCSSDNTKDIINGFGNRIRVIHHDTNRGISGARNTGIKACTSSLIAFLDGDDAWTQEKLSKQIEEFHKSPEIGLSYTSLFDCDNNLNPVRIRKFKPRSAEYVFNELYLNAFPIPPSTVIVRRNVFEECGLFNEELRTGEDYECWLRIAMKFSISCTHEALCLRRNNPLSLSRSVHFDSYMLATFRIIELCKESASKLDIKLPVNVEQRKKIYLHRGFRESMNSNRDDAADFFYNRLADAGELKFKIKLSYKLFHIWVRLNRIRWWIKSLFRVNSGKARSRL
jgi:glycosyltransferase involved in cell wall biosynthesis